jgi:hypothetical protein
MDKAVFGLVRNKEEAENIVKQFMSEGFSESDISVLYADRSADTKGNLEQWDTGSVAAGQPKKSGLGVKNKTKAAEGAATGGTIGGLIGGTLGLLAGIGSLAIPGMGIFIAAGPIMAALAGSGVGGSIGLLTGALVGLGIPEYVAVHYADKLRNENSVLIAVHVTSSEQIDHAKRIFEANHAEDVAYTNELAASSKGSAKKDSNWTNDKKNDKWSNDKKF